MSYEDWGLRTFPRALKGAWGRLYVAAVAGIVQRVEDAATDAVAAKYAATAPDDALPYLAHDVAVPHYADVESLGVLRDRAADPWSWHTNVGKLAGLEDIFTALGFDWAQTHVLDASTGDHWFHVGGWWSVWAIATRDPSWGIPASDAIREYVYQSLWRFKWAHGMPAYVVVVEGTGFVWDLIQAEGYTWTSFEALALTWDEVDDVTAEVIQTGRLWDALDLETGVEPTWTELEAFGKKWARMMTGT